MNLKEKINKIVRQFLMIFGGISMIGIIIIIGGIFYMKKCTDDTQPTSTSTEADVGFVLNSCGLGEQRIESLKNSYTTEDSFRGDGLDAYAIKITNVTIEELEIKLNREKQWYRCDSLPKMIDESLSFIGGWQKEIPWFPTESLLRTKKFYVFPSSTHFDRMTPTKVELIFINPAEKMVYYIHLIM